MVSQLNKRLDFLVEADKLKSVLRRTSPIGQHLKRKENSAEHSWQVALAALILFEHADGSAQIDLFKVMKMLLIHDLVEVDVGDTFHYLKAKVADLAIQELAAAKRIFGLLPDEQALELLNLWKEFDENKTSEAIYANALDRMVAVLCNTCNQGGSMQEFGIKAEMAIEKNKSIEDGSKEMWEEAKSRILKMKEYGYIG